MLANPQVAEETVEEVGLPHVIVLSQHVHQERLAEAAWADEKEILVAGLNLGDEAALINIVVVVEAHVLPVLHSVWNLFRILLLHAL